MYTTNYQELYLDNLLIITNNADISTNSVNSSVYLGGNFNHDYLDGYLDEIMIFDQVLGEKSRDCIYNLYLNYNITLPGVQSCIK